MISSSKLGSLISHSVLPRGSPSGQPALGSRARIGLLVVLYLWVLDLYLLLCQDIWIWLPQWQVHAEVWKESFYG